MLHEFPQREDPYVDDLGRRARTFRFEGYVIGADYVAQKNALLSALEDKAGPGELVHPYYGRKRGICNGVSVRETIADGGVALFAIEFIETPKQIASPTDSVDSASQVTVAADAGFTATDAEFQAAYSTTGQPSFAVKSLANDLVGRTRQLKSSLSAVTKTTQELAKLNQATQSLITNVSTLIRTPSSILTSFVNAIDAIGDTVASAPRQILKALHAAYQLPPPPLAFGTTGTRVRERANQAALTAALRQVLAIQSARAIVQVTYQTIEDATLDAADVIGMIDGEAAIAGDEAYPALMQLRAMVIRAVPGNAALARILTVERRTALPSLLLAYQLYGSVDGESDVVARNNPQHPGFMSGLLRVLSSE